MNAPIWRKSCHANNTCVHVAVFAYQEARVVLVRDERHEVLALRPAAWRRLVAEVKAR
jgi:hypothetical protein